MLIYLVRRVLVAIPTLVAISLVVFSIIALAPGDPFSSMGESQLIPDEIRRRLRAELGLDQPIHVQYLSWVGTLLRGDLGYSFSGGASVGKLIAERLPTTLFVMGTAFVLGLVLAFTVGTISAVRQNSWVDNVASAFAYVGFSLPPFFTGLVLILVFTVQLRLLPMSYVTTVRAEGLDWLLAHLRQAAMPIAVIAFYEGAVLTRYVRTAVIEVLTCDFVRTARGKGLRERTVLTRHALRNALIPVVTVAAFQLPGVFTGSIVVEAIFAIPGIGTLLIRAYDAKDIPVMMAVLTIYSSLVVLFNFVADALYGALDPRIRLA